MSTHRNGFNRNGHQNGNNGHVARTQTRGGHKKKVRHVDFHNNPLDHECGLLGAGMMTTGYIIRQTGGKLSAGQIQYRLAKLGIKRQELRNGVGHFAQVYMRAVRPVLEPKFETYLRQNAVASHANVSGRRNEPSVSRPSQRYAEKIRA